MRIIAASFLAFAASGAVVTVSAQQNNNYYNRNSASSQGNQWNSNRQNNNEEQEKQDEQQQEQQQEQQSTNSGYSANAQQAASEYMENVGYYTNTRDANWHYSSGRQYGQYGSNANANYNNNAQASGGSGGNAYDAYSSTSTTTTYGQDEVWDGYENYAWLSDYNIKFDGCARDYDEGVGNSQLLAKFKLCPADSKYCRHAGEYVIPMDQFVDAYETVISTDNGCAAQEETCIASCQDMYDGYQSSSYQAQDYQEEEAAEDNNNNNAQNSGGSQYSNYAQNNYAYGYQNGGGRRKLEENSAFDFDGCMSDCMNSAGMSSCENQGNGASSVAQGVDDLVQCKQIGDNAYVGAVCKHGGVYMDTFKDSACSKSAPSGTFEALNNGMSLPTSNLVTSELVTCGGGICQHLYADSGKCEAKMDKEDKSVAGCGYIHRMSRSKAHLWIILVSCLLIGGAVLAAAYMLYSQQATRARLAARMTALLEEGQTHYDNGVKTVHDSMSNMQESVSNMMKPVTGTTDADAGTVNSEDATNYEGSKMEDDKVPKVV